MTITEFEGTVSEVWATTSQREAGAYLDLMGLAFMTDYTLENCEEWAAALLGHPSERLREAGACTAVEVKVTARKTPK